MIAPDEPSQPAAQRPIIEAAGLPPAESTTAEDGLQAGAVKIR